MVSGKSFTETDSWAVATAFVVFAVLSVLIEKATHWAKRKFHGKPTLLKVLHKAEEELFLLGCVSFTLLVFEDMLVENSCVESSRFDGDTWAMCPATSSSYDSGYSSNSSSYASSRRRLTAAEESVCGDDREPFLSAAVLHQVHLFIFFLALAHVCYTTATLTLGRWRLRNMMTQRRRHVEKTMAKVGSLTKTDAHTLVGKMISRNSLLRLEREEGLVQRKEGDVDVAKDVSASADTDGAETSKDGVKSPSFLSRKKRTETETSREYDDGERVTKFAADALRGDGAALAEKQHHFRFGLSRSSKDHSLTRKVGTIIPSITFLAEAIGIRLPESTLIRFELLFLRQHNIRSLSFDFPQFVTECVDCDSGDQLGITPGRWAIATLIICAMGPFGDVNLVISFASLGVLIGLACWLKTRVDYILAVEKRGGHIDDGRVYLLSRPRLAKDLFIFILYQQAFHVASWVFGVWQIGVGGRYGCYYGQTWSVFVSVVTVLLGLLVGGYIILPLEALVSQMSGAFRRELLDKKVVSVVTQLAHRLEQRRRGVRKFKTETHAVVHIQREFRARRRRNLEKAARVAMLHAASRARGGSYQGFHNSSGTASMLSTQSLTASSAGSIGSIDEVRVDVLGDTK
jgi:hypothetical protein